MAFVWVGYSLLLQRLSTLPVPLEVCLIRCFRMLLELGQIWDFSEAGHVVGTCFIGVLDGLARLEVSSG